MVLLKQPLIKKTAFLLLFVSAFFSCVTTERGVENVTEQTPEYIESPELPPREEESPPPNLNRLTIIAVGDNLYHDTMIRDGEEGNYETAYDEIRDLVEQADIAFINQETILAGESFGFSGYPRFSTPQKVGEVIAAAGFDVVNQATNHIMDQGEKAVFATLDFWDNFPRVALLGIHRSEEARGFSVIINKNNINVGFLSYTYGTNGLPVPRDKPYLVSLIDTEIMAREIDALRPLCDFLVVSMHWGEEYEHSYNRTQERLLDLLAEHKVDLVIGHHPHVIQPVEYKLRPDGELMLCYYSLGNLISGQTQNATMLGAMAYISIEKIPAQETEKSRKDKIIFLEAGAIPLVTHYEENFTNFRVYPLYSYNEELAGKHRQTQMGRTLTIDYLRGLAAKVFGDREITQTPFTEGETQD